MDYDLQAVGLCGHNPTTLVLWTSACTLQEQDDLSTRIICHMLTKFNLAFLIFVGAHTYFFFLVRHTLSHSPRNLVAVVIWLPIWFLCILGFQTPSLDYKTNSLAFSAELKLN